jgi:hypothetical protein
VSTDPFKSPHYDIVTSLAMLNGYLVSGSRDKNVKLWPSTNPLYQNVNGNNTKE